MRKRLVFLLVAITALAIMLFPQATEAATEDEVTITAVGYVCGGAENFMIIYVSDYEVEMTWDMGEDAENTMIRAAYGHVPEDIDDGYLVYYGNETATSDTAITLNSPESVYYRVFSQRADGAWSSFYVEGDTEEFMSASFLFMGFLALAIFLTWFSSRRPEILVRMSAGLMWMALAFWVFEGDVTNLGLEESWTIVLACVFLCMIAVPFIFQINTEIRKEAKGTSWSEWGKPPQDNTSAYWKRRNEMRSRLSRPRRNRLW